MLKTIYSETKRCNNFLEVTIIPGNLNFRLEGKSYYFNRNMPLEAEGREGQLHRVIDTSHPKDEAPSPQGHSRAE